MRCPEVPLCQECQEQLDLQSAVNLPVSPVLLLGRLPSRAAWSHSLGNSSQPGALLNQHPCCQSSQERGQNHHLYFTSADVAYNQGKRERHTLNHTSTILFSLLLFHSPPLSFLQPPFFFFFFFSVADGGGKIPGGQDKLLNVVISNGSS